MLKKKKIPQSVPAHEIDKTMTRPRDGEVVVRYFEDNTFSAVQAAEVVEFNMNAEPIASLLQNTAFSQLPSVRRIVNFINSGTAPRGFKWTLWDDDASSSKVNVMKRPSKYTRQENTNDLHLRYKEDQLVTVDHGSKHYLAKVKKNPLGCVFLGVVLIQKYLFFFFLFQIIKRGEVWPMTNKQGVGPHYYVHYQGWSDRYDEWVPQTRIRMPGDRSSSTSSSSSSSPKPSSTSSAMKKDGSIFLPEELRGFIPPFKRPRGRPSFVYLAQEKAMIEAALKNRRSLIKGMSKTELEAMAQRSLSESAASPKRPRGRPRKPAVVEDNEAQLDEGGKGDEEGGHDAEDAETPETTDKIAVKKVPRLSSFVGKVSTKGPSVTQGESLRSRLEKLRARQSRQRDDEDKTSTMTTRRSPQLSLSSSASDVGVATRGSKRRVLTDEDNWASLTQLPKRRLFERGRDDGEPLESNDSTANSGKPKFLTIDLNGEPLKRRGRPPGAERRKQLILIEQEERALLAQMLKGILLKDKERLF